MEMSARLGRLIFYIEIWHFLALVVILAVNAWFYRHGTKGGLLYRFLALQGALLIWVVSKMLKTLSPTISLRWAFIVTQYFGVCFLGVLFFLFAWRFVFDKDFPIPGRVLLYTAALGFFLVVLTNPRHHLFYATYNFYRDTFGPLFYAFSVFTYFWILTGILLFFWGVKKSLRDGRSSGIFFIVMAAVLPFLINAAYTYRIIRPLFDYTPLFMTFSLTFFGIAAFRSQFLGIVPSARKQVLLELEDPFILTDRKGKPIQNTKLKSGTFPHKEIRQNGRYYRLYRKTETNKGVLYHYADETNTEELQRALEDKNRALHRAVNKLEIRNRQTVALMQAETINRSRRLLHDVLGHSLTQIIYLLRLAIVQGTNIQTGTDLQKQLLTALSDGRELLHSRLTGEIGEGNSLTIALRKLLTSLILPKVQWELLLRGTEIPLPEDLVQELMLCCREGITNAIKHGGAGRITLMLLYGQESLALIITDNGNGCSGLKHGNGLSLMRRGITGYRGKVKAITEQEGGFQLTIKVPIAGTTPHGPPVPHSAHHQLDEDAQDSGHNRCSKMSSQS